MESLKRLRELTDTLNKVEQNLVEEKNILNFILENTTDGYWDWNIKTGYEYLSTRFKSQLGYKDNEMDNKPESWMSICDVMDLDIMKKQLDLHFSNKLNEIRNIIKFTHKKGYIVKILCRGKVVKFDEFGNPERMIGTHTIID